jgi:hypothetical protein
MSNYEQFISGGGLAAMQSDINRLNPGPKVYRGVAYNNTGSLAVPTNYAVALSTNNNGTDPLFNQSTGVIGPFPVDVEWTSTVMVNPTCSSGTPLYYTDAEVSVDGGTTWIRGSNSLRIEQLAAGYTRTREFSFSGKFAAGSMLRFIEWASASGVTLQTVTVTNNSVTSIAPARRITYSYMPAVIS